MKRTYLLAMSLVLGLAAAPAQAVSVTYDLSGIELDLHTSGPGLVIQSEVLALPSSFVLDDGDSFTFDAFRVWTNESSLNAADRVARDASATFMFSSPGFSSGTVTGSSNGQDVLGGLAQQGVLNWGGPALIATATATYLVELTSVTFNTGPGGLSPGIANGAIVQATITQLTSVVPEPGTALMAALGAGSVGLMTLARRRTRTS